MKLTPEEERLSTLARLHAEHPGNTAAWNELKKAAIRFAASLGASGRKKKPPPMTEAEIRQVRRERDARVADKKRRRAEWEAAQRRGQ